jgi:hypothetical protein
MIQIRVPYRVIKDTRGETAPTNIHLAAEATELSEPCRNLIATTLLVRQRSSADREVLAREPQVLKRDWQDREEMKCGSQLSTSVAVRCTADGLGLYPPRG